MILYNITSKNRENTKFLILKCNLLTTFLKRFLFKMLFNFINCIRNHVL